MKRLIVSLCAAAIGLFPLSGAACGWWGESIDETPLQEVVVGGQADAIDLTTPEGMARMSRAYRLGDHVPKDLAIARLWAARAAKAGHIGAMSDYAQFLETGIGGPVDLAGAVKWYRRAAEAGNANAQHSLANLYFDGRGVEKDIAEGETWLRRAAAAGHSSAAAQLASMIWAGSLNARYAGEACFWQLVANTADMPQGIQTCRQREPGLTDDAIARLAGQAREFVAASENDRQDGS